MFSRPSVLPPQPTLSPLPQQQLRRWNVCVQQRILLEWSQFAVWRFPLTKCSRKFQLTILTVSRHWWVCHFDGRLSGHAEMSQHSGQLQVHQDTVLWNWICNGLCDGKVYWCVVPLTFITSVSKFPLQNWSIFRIDSDTASFVSDVDECNLGSHDCGALYQCRNTQGSYRFHKHFWLLEFNVLFPDVTRRSVETVNFRIRWLESAPQSLVRMAITRKMECAMVGKEEYWKNYLSTVLSGYWNRDFKNRRCDQSTSSNNKKSIYPSLMISVKLEFLNFRIYFKNKSYQKVL